MVNPILKWILNFFKKFVIEHEEEIKMYIMQLIKAIIKETRERAKAKQL